MVGVGTEERMSPKMRGHTVLSCSSKEVCAAIVSGCKRNEIRVEVRVMLA